MKFLALGRIDPSIAISVAAAAVLFTTFGSPRAFTHTAAVLVKTAWFYLSNTRG